jgi:hypothetical protein
MINVGDFPALIVGMARALQERKPVDMSAPLE